MTLAYVAIGSNLDPEANVTEAVRRLAERAPLVAASTFYRTESIPPGAPPFADGVVALDWSIDPRRLKLDVLRAIEAGLGRTRTRDRDAPRTLDCDLLLCGDAVVCDADLVLPHPDVRSRAFVAVPLLEIAPDLVLPDTGQRLASIVAELGPPSMTPLAGLTRAVREEVLHGSRTRTEARS